MASISDEVQQLRDDLRALPKSRFVEPDEFFDLLVSNRKLVRVDGPHARVKGLKNPDDGGLFYIEEEKLFNHPR